tara:strand:+ start:1364 stop:2842 length:1479 start_codon:yes stop_codon:yes gene_type:complete
VLFVVYLIVQANAINRLESVVLEKAPISVEMTQKLADIERTIGYVGFIHHFKNYIIRRDEQHYLKAMTSYDDAVKKIIEFEALTDKDELIHKIEHLKSTLEEYHINLIMAKRFSSDLSIQTLDKIVKVNDSEAERALRALQTYLLPKFEDIFEQTAIELSKLSQLTLLFNIIVAPIIVIVSYFIIQIVRRVHKLTSQLSSILDISPDGIVYISEQGIILQANSKACELLEYSEHELTKVPLEQLVAPEYRQYCAYYREQVFSANNRKNLAQKPRKMRALTKSNNEIELEITVASGYVANENRSVCIIRDMTHHNALKQKAEKDHLTSLLNRWMLDELLQKELDRCQRSNQPLSLLLVDIDNFKSVNDNFGHDAGDITLRKTADYLHRSTRSYDHIGRWGGDEFILVCPNLGAEDAINYAQRLVTNYQQYEKPAQHNTSLSIGISTTSECSNNKQMLFKNADIALYHAKKSGKNCIAHFDQRFSDINANATCC